MRPISSLLLALSVFGVLGCGGKSGAETVTVTGEVTMDGTPIPTGDIIFRADNGKGRGYAGKITDGKYELKSATGKLRVEIRASRSKAGAKPKALASGEEGMALEQYIPAKYNDKSTLTADVTASEKKFDFPLKSK
jgi:hypothetical protein